MIKAEYIELMNRQIDGVLGPREQEKLQAYFQQSEEARKYYSDLTRMSAELSSMRSVDPPADLKGTVMAAVRATRRRARSRQATTQSPFKSIWGWVIPKPAYSFGFGTVVGALIILIVFTLFQKGSGPDSSTVTGFMAPTSGGTAQTVDEATIDFHGSPLSAKVQRSNNRITLSVSSASAVSQAVTINFDASDLAFVGVVSDPGELANLASTPHDLTLSVAGAGKVELVFSDLTPKESHLTVAVGREAERTTRELSTGTARLPH